MALLYWYFMPLGIELGFNSMVLENFSKLVAIVEFAMTIKKRTHEELKGLHSLITEFLKGFQKVYIGDDPEKISRFRLCVFQIIHLPVHIEWYGSIRLGSQATVERMIEELSHKLHSKKAPFANMANLIYERQMLQLLSLYYPELQSTIPAVNKSSLLSKVSILQKERKPGTEFSKSLSAICHHKQIEISYSLKLIRWGKLHLKSGVILNSQLIEMAHNKMPARSHRYFEASNMGANPIFGDAIAFFHIDAFNETVVVFHPLIQVIHTLGTIQGKWANDVGVLSVSRITNLVRILKYGEKVYILRKHPGLEWLTPEERGQDGDDNEDWSDDM